MTKLHPLNSSTDPSLFTWSELTDMFSREHDLEFRTMDIAQTLPSVFDELQVGRVIESSYGKVEQV